MEITKTLEELRDRIERPRQLFGITFGLNRDECAVLIRRVHALLPEQVKEASVITRETERIVGAAKQDAQLARDRAKNEGDKLVESARKEAERILEQARIERARMLSESEILKLAKAQAEEVRVEADAEAARLKREANDYALDVLVSLETAVSKVMGTIERGKNEMQRPTAPLTPTKAR